MQFLKAAALVCALSLAVPAATPAFAADPAPKMIAMARIENDQATARMFLHTLMTDPTMKEVMIKELLSDKGFTSDLDQERALQGRGG